MLAPNELASDRNGMHEQNEQAPGDNTRRLNSGYHHAFACGLAPI